MQVWDSWPKEKKKEFADSYKERFGKDFIPPCCDKRGINVEPRIESLEEIDRLMRQKPHGRMGRG